MEHFPRHWPFVRGIHRSPVNSPHKGQWRGALMFSLICALNKRLSKQSWDWWFETPSHLIWRHYNSSGTSMTVKQYLVIESLKMLILEMQCIDTFWSHGFCYWKAASALSWSRGWTPGYATGFVHPNCLVIDTIEILHALLKYCKRKIYASYGGIGCL